MKLIAEGISIVIPTFRSAETLPRLVERLLKMSPSFGAPFELIFVNDGSPDETWSTIQRLASAHPTWIRGFNLMRNYGQHNALLCGIRAAHYDTIVTMDDDLQNPPEEIPRLLARLREGYDVVYGTPQVETHGLFRNLASVITKLALQTAMNAETARMASAFRVFRTDLRRAFENYRSPFVSVDVLLTWATTRFASLPVRQDDREIGVSNYTFWKLFRHATNMMTGFSVLPLQLASLIGFAFTLFGVAVLAYVLIRWLLAGSVVPGFAFLASAIAIFSGAQLFALGIIGEYLARMHFRIMDRPSYAIASSTVGAPPDRP